MNSESFRYKPEPRIVCDLVAGRRTEPIEIRILGAPLREKNTFFHGEALLQFALTGLKPRAES